MKRLIRKLIRRYGFDIIKFRKDQMGIYPFYDMSKFIKSSHPVLFDIGANVGQTVKDFDEVFKTATIHAFEPSPDTFQILKNNTSKVKNLHLWNLGVGGESGKLMLNEYVHSNTNSFIDIHGQDVSGLKNKSLVDIVTVDEFISENNIQKIDVLKIDTEGFEMEVFKGSIESFTECKIGLLFFEISFTKSHDDTPTFTELWDFVVKHDFELVTIYPLVHRKNMGTYTNVLFKHKSY